MKQTCPTSKRRQRGGSIVEVALMAPWIFFLFVGIFDFGFYAYAAICTQNAARVVALSAAQTATASVGSCGAALGELTMLPNIGANPPGTKCSVVATTPSVTQSVPVNVCVGALNGKTGTAVCGLAADKCTDSIASGATDNQSTNTCQLAVVTYQSIPLVPIPGIMMGQFTLSRAAEEKQTTP